VSGCEYGKKRNESPRHPRHLVTSLSVVEVREVDGIP
jgi:hypothetical protein